MFQQSLHFDPAEPLEAFLERVPAAWCVYLLADAEGRPIQLLCVKNLRASLRRRLGQAPEEEAGPSRRIDYRGLVRQVRWSRVDSVFEQDWLYLECARQLFPESYAGVLGFKPAWWLQMDATAAHPRPARTTEPGPAGAGRFFGPLPDKHAAQKLVHAVEELFDLCRDAAALANAPAAPCQWKQMAKCVGPCDGSVSLEAYRALVDHAADVLTDIDRAIQRHQLRMRQAAAALEYEAAGEIKGYLERLESPRTGPNRHLRRLEDFRFLAVMPGRRKDTAKLFTITPGRIQPLACLREPPTQRRGEEVLRAALQELSVPAESIETPAQRERLSLVTHHLFPSRRVSGVFIPLAELEEKRFAAAFREVNRPAKLPADEREDEEGEVRGLQAL